MPGTLVADAAAERQRLAALDGYQVLDSDPESDFDDIVALAAQLCRTPSAAISLIAGERQWFKARVGINSCETNRQDSFCAHAMLRDEVMQVPDALLDPRFRGNPVVTGKPFYRFYAGAPLITADGQALGTLCVLDHEPRQLTPAESQGLRTLARHVMAQLELRQYARGLDVATERLRDADRIKDEFLARVNHELRTPLAAINGYLEVLGDPGLQPGAGDQFKERIRRNSDRLVRLVEDMLLAAEAGHSPLALTKSVVDLGELARHAVESNSHLAHGRGLALLADVTEPVIVHADEQRLTQALERLVLNAVKFTPSGAVTIRTGTRGEDAVLEVRDTGIGISQADQERVLAPFRRAATAEHGEVQGAGLGLSIVKAIVDSHGGTVGIESEPGHGAAITVTLPRHDVC